ncbi:MAG: hypothetical protein AAF411_22945, partial [Myxococcota bacterium]
PAPPPAAERAPGPTPTPAQRTAVVAQLNETCADVWCEGSVSFWFHDVNCTGLSCVVQASARMDLEEWRLMGRERPSAAADPEDLEGAEFGPVNDPAVGPGSLGEVVVLGAEFRVQGPIWSGAEPVPEAFELALGEAIDAWPGPVER